MKEVKHTRGFFSSWLCQPQFKKTCKYLGIMTAAALWASPLSVDARSYCDDEIPIEVQAACDIYGEEYNICPELLEAICYHESRYLADVQNGSCKGVMQIKEPVHKKRMEKLGVTDIWDIDSNIHVGADLLAELFALYDDPAVVLAAYHGETNGVEKAKNGIYSNYVKEILEKSAELERAHGK